MKIHFNPRSVDDYCRFKQVKLLPQYTIVGREAWFPDEYASQLGIKTNRKSVSSPMLHEWMFDYQAAITGLAIEKQKYAIFADCGLGKTVIFLHFARHAFDAMNRKRAVLILSPLNVVRQTVTECRRFFGKDYPLTVLKSSDIQGYLDNPQGIGISNYEGLKPELKQGTLGGLILDESSILKSHYGKWGGVAIRLGRELDWKLCCTGTPAPNDRIEYANHAVFLDQFPTVNSFLATYFVNRGQTQDRWALKPHALRPFYRSLSHWSIFLSNPAVHGWRDNDTRTIPPIHVTIHPVDMTAEQKRIFQTTTGELLPARMGGITKRAKLGQLGKGRFNGEDVETNKPGFIRELIASWQDKESTICWCMFNDEQSKMASTLPLSASITGATKYETRMRYLEGFLAGETRTMVSKPKILGFGLNLQIATRQVFSGLADSYEQYYQAVKRSNRYGSKFALNVHIPVTELEEPMVQNVLRKAKLVQQDTEEQESLFRELGHGG